jgi:zinc-ribbon domain
MLATGFCPHCGAPRQEWARFCGKCGKRYNNAPETPAASVPALPVPAPARRQGGLSIVGPVVALVIIAVLVAGFVVLTAKGGGNPDAGPQFVGAYNAFSNAVNSAASGMNGATSLADIQSGLSQIGASAATMTTAMQGISFPDKAKADADAFTRAVVVVQERAVAGSKMTTQSGLILQIADIRSAIQDAAAAGAQLRNDLGLPAPS